MKKYKIGKRFITADSIAEAVKISKLLDSPSTRVVTKDETIEELTAEEEKAVEDYRKAIQGTTNPKLLKIFSHILEEETEHLQELAEAKEIDDGCGKMKDMPDLETKSGRKMSFEQMAMWAIDKVPTRMWNKIGDKIVINNNSIVLVIKDDGVYFSTPDNNYGKYTNKIALQQDILKELKLN